MKILFYFYFITCVVQSSVLMGQVRNKILIVDTLEANNSNFFICQTDSIIDFEPVQIPRDSIVFNTNQTPNLICPISLIHEEAVIRLSIDDNMGYVELKNLYNIEFDTIIISKLKLINNCIPDTIFTRTTYWNETDSGLVNPPIKTEYDVQASKSNCKLKYSTDPTIELTINGVKYDCSLHISNEMSKSTHFHGRKPKRYRNNRKKYKGKKKIYFSGRKAENTYFYKGEINMKGP